MLFNGGMSRLFDYTAGNSRRMEITGNNLEEAAVNYIYHAENLFLLVLFIGLISEYIHIYVTVISVSILLDACYIYLHFY
jgi:hypothetical protein